MTSRYSRFWISLAYAAALIIASIAHAQTKPAAPLVTVYKTPT